MEIDEVVSDMNGSFYMENEKLTFRKLAFSIPGAAVDLAGDYDLDADHVDFLRERSNCKRKCPKR